MSDSPLHQRIKAACGNRTYKSVAEATGHNAETVRRYLRGHTPSVEFLESLCASYALNATWLLTGSGPMHAKDVRGATLSQANPSDLLAAVAESLERLIDRVDRIESYVQMLDVRLRHTSTNHDTHTNGQDSTHDGTDAADRSNADAVAGAIAQRSRQDDH
ncbi:MAG: hypothetical protein ACF8GE_05780 [Phycisphaerales bacterium JB043]